MNNITRWWRRRSPLQRAIVTTIAGLYAVGLAFYVATRLGLLDLNAPVVAAAEIALVISALVLLHTLLDSAKDRPAPPTVDAEEAGPRCRGCGYSLTGFPARCPECGRPRLPT